jgi:hypothetical protein
MLIDLNVHDEVSVCVIDKNVALVEEDHAVVLEDEQEEILEASPFDILEEDPIALLEEDSIDFRNEPPIDFLSTLPNPQNDGVNMIANAVTDCETAFVVYDVNYSGEEDDSGIQQVLFRDGEEDIGGGVEETIETRGGETMETGCGETTWCGEGYTVNTIAYLRKYGLE